MTTVFITVLVTTSVWIVLSLIVARAFSNIGMRLGVVFPGPDNVLRISLDDATYVLVDEAKLVRTIDVFRDDVEEIFS